MSVRTDGYLPIRHLMQTARRATTRCACSARRPPITVTGILTIP